VRGERGTAKSTAVRGLAPLLPAVAAAEGQGLAFAPGEMAPGGRAPDRFVAPRPVGAHYECGCRRGSPGEPYATASTCSNVRSSPFRTISFIID